MNLGLKFFLEMALTFVRGPVTTFPFFRTATNRDRTSSILNCHKPRPCHYKSRESLDLWRYGLDMQRGELRGGFFTYSNRHTFGMLNSTKKKKIKLHVEIPYLLGTFRVRFDLHLLGFDFLQFGKGEKVALAMELNIYMGSQIQVKVLNWIRRLNNTVI